MAFFCLRRSWTMCTHHSMSSCIFKRSPISIINFAVARQYGVETCSNEKVEEKKPNLISRLFQKKIAPSTSIVDERQQLKNEAVEEVSNEQQKLEETYLFIYAPKLYTICANYYDYNKFLTFYHLPDHVDTWFRITYLHLWMILVRLSRERTEFFNDCREDLVNAMWTDVENRFQQLKTVPNFTVTRKALSDWCNAYYCLLFLGVQEYDEALLSDDPALAAALWRNLFDSRPDYDVVALNNLVRYVRMHINRLDNMDLDTLMKKGISFDFIDYKL